MGGRCVAQRAIVWPMAIRCWPRRSYPPSKSSKAQLNSLRRLREVIFRAASRQHRIAGRRDRAQLRAVMQGDGAWVREGERRTAVPSFKGGDKARAKAKAKAKRHTQKEKTRRRANFSQRATAPGTAAIRIQTISSRMRLGDTRILFPGVRLRAAQLADENGHDAASAPCRPSNRASRVSWRKRSSESQRQTRTRVKSWWETKRFL